MSEDKEKKPVKILWVSDGGVATGFARVAHSIIEHLPEHYEIHHLAVNYNGDPYKTRENHFLYPAKLGGDLLGINRLKPLIKSINPDLIFILNDPWVVNDYLSRIETDQRVIAYTPVDAQFLEEAWCRNLQKINQIIAYNEFGKKELSRDVEDFDDIEVIPHGTDLGKFYPTDKIEAKKSLGLPEDSFIIFNGNRNTPRKRVDLTIKAFAKFAKNKPKNVFLYLHMGNTDAGWDIGRLCKRYGVSKRLIITDKNLSPANYISDADLNRIYNACDVGINTSMGEGFGLINVEHACCKVPQIVPNYSATAEIFEPNMALHIDVERIEPHLGILTEGCIINIDHAAECMEKLYQDRELGKQLAENAYNKFTSEKYTWKSVAAEFTKVFERVLTQEPKAKSLAEPQSISQ